MQIIIKLKNDSILDLPVNYNYFVQAAIFSVLRNYNPEYSELLHDKGYGEQSRYKFFTFGLLRGHYKSEGKRLYFDTDISLEIRSISPEFCNILTDALMNQGYITICNYNLVIENIKLSDFNISSDRIDIMMETPVVVMTVTEDKKTVYHSPFEDVFPEIITQNFINKFNVCCGFIPDDSVKIKCSGSYRKIVTKYKGIWVNGYKGGFELSGRPEYLSFLYDVGLGIKTSDGFGMFNVIKK